MISREVMDEIRERFRRDLPAIQLGQDPMITSPRVAFRADGLPSLHNLLEMVGAETGHTAGDLRGPSRPKSLADARALFCVLANELLNTKPDHIGGALHKHRKTINEAMMRGRDLIKSDVKFRETYQRIKDSYAV